MVAQQFDALVVGAGWSGLTCALQLARAGKQVLCVEARKRIGGRAFTHTWDDNTPMKDSERQAATTDTGAHSVDFGCSFIHGYNEGNPARELAKRYDVATFIPKPTGTQIVGPNGPLAPTLSARLEQNLGNAQAAAKALGQQRRAEGVASLGTEPVSSILLGKNSPLYDSLSKEEKPLATSLAKLLHVPFGVEMDQVALDYFGSEMNFAGTDAAPQGGFSPFLSKIAKDFTEAGGRIQLGEAVHQISRQSQSNVKVVTSGEQGEQSYEAKTAIVTIPLAVLKTQTGIFEPSLDEDRLDVISRVCVGNLNKVLLAYKDAWWPTDTGTFLVLPSHERPVDAGTSLEDLFASTTLMVSSLCAPNGLPASMTSSSLLVMLGGVPAKVLESHDRLDVASALHKYLVSRIANKDANHVSALTHTFYSRWARQPFTGGATTTPITLGNTPSDFVTLGTPTWDGHLYFAGEHCNKDHRGSIAGAIVSADDTAQAVLAHLQQANL